MNKSSMAALALKGLRTGSSVAAFRKVYAMFSEFGSVFKQRAKTTPTFGTKQNIQNGVKLLRWRPRWTKVLVFEGVHRSWGSVNPAINWPIS
jgi:hypothetical protein